MYRVIKSKNYRFTLMKPRETLNKQLKLKSMSVEIILTIVQNRIIPNRIAIQHKIHPHRQSKFCSMIK